MQGNCRCKKGLFCAKSCVSFCDKKTEITVYLNINSGVTKVKQIFTSRRNVCSKKQRLDRDGNVSVFTGIWLFPVNFTNYNSNVNGF